MEGHLKNLYQKLDVHTRHEAVLKAAEIAAASLAHNPPITPPIIPPLWGRQLLQLIYYDLDAPADDLSRFDQMIVQLNN